MKDDAGELLRRLSIICLEDAMLHPDLPLVVWLMAAHAKVKFDGICIALACLPAVNDFSSLSNGTRLLQQ